MGHLLKNDACGDYLLEQERQYFNLEINKTRDTIGKLETLHTDLRNYDLVDFGICERRLQLPPLRQLSQSELIEHLNDLQHEYGKQCVQRFDCEIHPSVDRRHPFRVSCRSQSAKERIS